MSEKLWYALTPCRISQVWKNEPDGTLAVLKGFEIVWLNETASHIWLLCNGRTPVLQIVESIFEKYPSISKQHIEKDVESFLFEAEKMGLLLCDWKTF